MREEEEKMQVNDNEQGQMSTSEWDPRNDYTDVIDAVREASEGGKVVVFKEGGEGARVWYYVLAVSRDRRKDNRKERSEEENRNEKRVRGEVWVGNVGCRYAE